MMRQMTQLREHRLLIIPSWIIIFDNMHRKDKKCLKSVRWHALDMNALLIYPLLYWSALPQHPGKATPTTFSWYVVYLFTFQRIISLITIFYLLSQDLSSGQSKSRTDLSNSPRGERTRTAQNCSKKIITRKPGVI